MAEVTGGTLTSLLGKVFQSFLKSLEGVFSDDGNSETKVEKGKVIITSKKKPDQPVVDENGKTLDDNAAVFEMVTTLELADSITLTKETAKSLAESPESWDNLPSIRLDLAFQGSNKITRKAISSKDAAKELTDYWSKYDLRNKATYMVVSNILIFNEGKQDIIPTGTETSLASLSQVTNAASKLKMSLRKVTGKSGVEVQLRKITANYDILQAMDDVTSIVEDDAFVDQLPENEDTFYEVTSDESDYDVNCCDDFNCEDIIQQMVWNTLRTSLHVRTSRMACGQEFPYNGMDMYDDLIFVLDRISFILADALVDIGCSNIAGFEFQTDPADFGVSGDTMSLAAELEDYLACLEIVYDCVSKGIQVKLDRYFGNIEDAIRAFKHN